MLEVYEYSRNEIDDDWLEWANLWYPDFEEAAIDRCYLATFDDVVVGFQTIDRDNLCCAIEVHPEYQGQGVANALINESGIYKPDRNENPDFWARMEKLHGN